MNSDRTHPARLPLFLGLFAATLALRPQLVVIAPLAPMIQLDLGASHATVGLLSTIPVWCMGVFAPLGPWLASHLGPRNALAACLLVMAGFGLARVLVPDVTAIVAMTGGIGFGMGTAGALMSIVVKDRAPGRPALATGAYAAGISGGAFAAGAFAVPLDSVLGGWRPVLAVFALVAIVSAGCWLALLSRDKPVPGRRVRPAAMPWRSPIAWALVIVFGLQSLLYYGVISWLPAVYVERGWTEASAGSLVALMSLVGLAAGIAMPVVAERTSSRRLLLTSVAVVITVALVGVIAVPDLGVIWAASLGFALGGLLPLVLTLPVDVAAGSAAVGATTAFMLLGGYLIAGVGPVVLGLVRDATGNFSASLWLLVGIAVLFVASCTVLSPARLRRGVRPLARPS